CCTAPLVAFSRRARPSWLTSNLCRTFFTTFAAFISSIAHPPLLVKKTLDIYDYYRLHCFRLARVAAASPSATLEGITSALRALRSGPAGWAAVSQAGLGIEPLRPAPARSPGVCLKFTGARAGFWLWSLLFAMLLFRYKRFLYNHPVPPARLDFDLWPASPAAFVLHASLLPSDCVPYPLSEPGGADLKQSGLLRSVPFSATQNLAYLPCRRGSYGSTFPFFSGGGVSKKTAARNPSKILLCSQLYWQVCPHFPVLFSRSAFMRFEDYHDAAKLFPSHPHV